MMKSRAFRDIVGQYEVIFFDAYGVLKNSAGLIPGIRGTFDFLAAQYVDYYILTNDASRGPKGLAQSYAEAGLDMITADKIISSGMLARDYLQLKVSTGAVAYLGTDESAHYLEETGLRVIPVAELDLDRVDDVNAMVFLDDEGFEWRTNVNKVVNLLRLRNIPSIVANTDTSYPVSDKEVGVAIGSIADMVEKITSRKFIKFGKPDAAMFMFAYEHAAKAGKVSKNKILMVGDTLFTDILGGNKFGIDTALVLTGNTQAGRVMERIESSGIIPDHICESAVIG